MRHPTRFWLPSLVLGALTVIACSAAVAASSKTSRPDAARATAITAGVTHACALTDAGSVMCWGANRSGQLGNGTWVERHVPGVVRGLASGVAVSAANASSCALTSNGAAKCWGNNAAGQLGDGTTVMRKQPVEVSGLSGLAAISAGDMSTCALTNAGGVKCWGYNCCGQLGDGTSIDRHTPVDVIGLTTDVIAIAANGGYTCALTSAGGVKCWGNNSNGQLGDGTTDEHRTPVDVTGLTSGVAAITVGGLHTCALTSAGGVKCWGYNFAGQLGDGSRTDRHTPVDVLGLASGVVAISAGFGQTCALTSIGGVKCWGYNAFGQLGDGSTDEHHTPVDVSRLGDGVAALAANGQYTCALMRTGEIKCWGGNGNGQLGDGTRTNHLTPVAVVGFGGSLTPKKCFVPNVVGKRLVKARARIVQARCRVGTIRRVSSMKTRGIVVRQTPRAGLQLRQGSRVDLKVSRGR
jgi:alpha-tubulin suppressor-like RCC1 family protein